MKRFIILLCSAVSLQAADITLTWDRSPSTNITNYTLYASAKPLVAATDAPRGAILSTNVGTNISFIITPLKSGRWYFVVTAQNDTGIESDTSNVLQLEKPSPPAGVRYLVIENTTNVATANWNEFFRLKLVP